MASLRQRLAFVVTLVLVLRHSIENRSIIQECICLHHFAVLFFRESHYFHNQSDAGKTKTMALLYDDVIY